MELNVIRKLSIRADAPGVPETTGQLKQLADAQGKIVAISEAETRATITLDQARQRARTTLEVNTRQAAAFAAANDNLARSYDAVNDNAQKNSYALHITGIEAATTAAHLKTAAAAAYVLSPAFRGIVNSGATEAFKLMGPAAAATAATIGTALTPAISAFLAFITRVGIPILAVVEAWKALNAVTELGAERLEAVAKLQEQVAKAAGFPTERKEIISAEEVAQAIELNDRMARARKEIEERWLPLKRDLVGVGVQYNETWVELNQLIARGVGLLQQFFELAKNSGESLSRTINQGLKPILPAPTEEGARAAGLMIVPDRAPIEAARERLKGLMSDWRQVAIATKQTEIAGRDMRKELEEQKKAAESSRGEFERLANAIGRQTAAQEADIQTVGKSVGEHARLRAEFRLREAAAQDGIAIDEKVAAKIKQVADRAGEAALALEKARVASQIQFQQKTLFLDQNDVQIARQLAGIYGNDIPKALQSAEAGQLRFIQGMHQLKDLATSFATTLVQGLINGTKGMQSLTQAASQLATSLLQSAMQNPMSGGTLGWLPAIGAVIGATFLGRQQREREQRQQQLQQQQQAENAGIQRSQNFFFTAQTAGVRGTDVTAELARFEIEAQQRRLEETRAGGEAMAALEKTIAAQRLKIITDFAEQAVARQKEFQDREFAATHPTGGDSREAFLNRLALFDRDADKQREEEAKKGGEGLIDLEKALQAERAALEQQYVEAVLSRRREFQDRLFKALNDESTLQGQLAAFDRDARKQILEERKKGGEAEAELQRAIEAERARIIEEWMKKVRARQQSFIDQLFILGQDQDTLAGQLAIFDLQAQRQREEEARNGGEAMIQLELLLQAQRSKIISDWNKKIIEEQKRAFDEAKNFLEGAARQITDFVNHLKAGTQSPLSPLERLTSAQTAFEAQRQLALTGTPEQRKNALSSITQYANDLLEASRAYYGSSAQFQTIFTDVLAKLQALPSQVRPEDLIVGAIQDSADQVSSSVDQTTQQVDLAKQQIGALNSLTTAQNASTTTIANLMGNLVSHIDGQTPILRAIAFNTRIQVVPVWESDHLIQEAATAWGVLTLARGGIIPPGGLAYVGEHGPNPRMIRAGAEPVTVTPHFVANDNDSSVAELRLLRKEVAALRGEIARLTNVTGHGHAETAAAVDNAGSRQARAIQHASERPKAKVA